MKKLYFFTLLISAVFSLPARAVELDQIDEYARQVSEVASSTSSTLSKARELIKVATTTAGVAVDAYNKAEQAVSSTVEVVKRGSAVYENLKPIITSAGDLWNSLTNNNELWRVAAVVGTVFVLWIVIRLAL